jgi:sugar/nucleoside kinase (ribokinase family)
MTLVACLGELIYDVIVSTPRGPGRETAGGVLLGCRGGGSAMNVAANLSAAGAPNEAAAMEGQIRAVAWGGLDIAGDRAVNELVDLGVQVFSDLVEGAETRRIFQHLQGAEVAPWETALDHRVARLANFQLRCAVCDRTPRSLEPSEVGAWTASAVHDADVLVLDRICRSRAALAAQARRRGAAVVVDIGVPILLRHHTPAQCRAWLKSASALFLSNESAQWLLGRPVSSAPLPVDDVKQLRQSLKVPLLTVGQGPWGLTYATDAQHRAGVGHLPAPVVLPVVDDTGAGDAFVASLVRQMAWKFVGSPDIALAIEAAVSSVTRVLGAFGARGHLPTPGGSSALVGVPLDALRARADREGSCLVCLRP